MSEESRRTAAALDALGETLSAARREIDQLADRVAGTRQAVASGVVLSDFVAAEDRPLIITKMTVLIDRMSDAAAEVRRAEAHQLRAEGPRHEHSAQLFGVTRQRAAALLAGTPASQQPTVKRPRRPNS